MRIGKSLRSWVTGAFNNQKRTGGEPQHWKAKRRLAMAASAAVEPLEKRTMLTATPLYWDPTGASTASGGAGTWDTSTAEWRSGSPTGSLVAWSNAGDANAPYQAIFPGTGGGVALGTSVSAVSLSFAADGYSINGGSDGYTLTLSGGIGQIDVTPDSTAAISASLSAGPGLTKTNTGILNLTGTVTGTTAQTLNVEQGLVGIFTSESWQTVEAETAGSLMTEGSSAGLIVSGGITVDGAFYHDGGTVESQTLTIDSTGTFVDTSGSLSGSVSSLAITNNGFFDSVSDQSLNGTTGSFTNSGLYEVDNASGSGTTTLLMSFTNTNGTINVAGGTLSIPDSITVPAGTGMTLDGTGTVSVPSLQLVQSTVQQNSGTLSITDNLSVGGDWLNGGQYNLAGGTLNAGSLGIGVSSTATFTQTGGSLETGHTEVGTYGNGAIVQSGGTSSFYDLYFGVSGQATFNLSGGSSSAYSINVGRYGGSAAINLSGAATLASANTESIADTGATGSFTQSGTSTNTVGGGGLDIGAGGTGTYTLSSGTLDSSWFGLGGGSYGNGKFIQSGGNFTVSYGSGIGSDSSTSYGTYLMSGGSLSTGYNVDIGSNGGNGSFNQTGGTVDFSNGSLIMGVGATSATFNVFGGSFTDAQNVYVGYSSPATFTQTGGSVTVDGDLVISGDQWDTVSSAIGTYDLSGTGELTTGRTFIGFTSDGFLNQSGGTDTTGWLVLDGLGDSVGTYNQTGGTLSATTTTNVQHPSSSGDSVVDEGSTYTLDLSTSIPIAWWYWINNWTVGWGDGDSDYLPGNPSSATHVYESGGVTDTINADAYHANVTYQTNAIDVKVVDVPATIAPITDQTVNTGSGLSISTTFTDPGADETHSGFINWGDGTSSPLSVTESDGSGTLSATHTYNVHGNYTPQIQLTDSGGAVAMNSFNVDALYVAPSLGIVAPTDAQYTGQAATLGAGRGLHPQFNCKRNAGPGLWADWNGHRPARALRFRRSNRLGRRCSRQIHHRNPGRYAHIRFADSSAGVGWRTDTGGGHRFPSRYIAGNHTHRRSDRQLGSGLG
jgi:hypothetical protein